MAMPSITEKDYLSLFIFYCNEKQNWYNVIMSWFGNLLKNLHKREVSTKDK